MRSTVAAAFTLALVLGACSSDRPDAGRGVQGLPLVGAPLDMGGRLIGRIVPFQNASFRDHGPLSRPSSRAGGGLCGVAGLEGTNIDPITSQVAGCGVSAPVRVTHVAGVKLSQGAIMDCPTAQALHEWVTTGVQPAIGRMGGGVAELRVAAHYVCRPRNHRSGARISEHGKGKAIDISAIILANGDSMSVRDDWRGSRYSRALQQMHRAACGTFGTTLGPGSDGMHEDHFHYDTARHRNGAYCR
jgi:hypothetical protein